MTVVSNKEFHFRPMHLEDLQQVHQMEQIVFPTPWSLKSYHFEVERNPSSDPWVAAIQHLEGNSEEIVAYIVPWFIVDEIHIANLAVQPAFRRKGLAKRLLQDALQRARLTGIKSATLEVRASNLAAQALYRSFGFEEAGRRKRYYQDNREDAIILRQKNIANVLSQSQLETT